MGNICCDAADERRKNSAFSSFHDREFYKSGSTNVAKPISSLPSHSSTQSGGAPDTNTATTLLKLQQAQAEAELERKRLEEQKRLDQIVASAGRDMITLYGRDGSSSSFRLKTQGQLWSGGVAYYDATFAGAAARELFRDSESSGGQQLFMKEIDSRLLRDERRMKLMDFLLGKTSNAVMVDEALASEPLDRRVDWREMLRDIVPSSVTIAMETLPDDLTENCLEREVLFQGLQPLVEILP